MEPYHALSWPYPDLDWLVMALSLISDLKSWIALSWIGDVMEDRWRTSSGRSMKDQSRRLEGLEWVRVNERSNERNVRPSRSIRINEGRLKGLKGVRVSMNGRRLLQDWFLSVDGNLAHIVGKWISNAISSIVEACLSIRSHSNPFNRLRLPLNPFQLIFHWLELIPTLSIVWDWSVTASQSSVIDLGFVMIPERTAYDRQGVNRSSEAVATIPFKWVTRHLRSMIYHPTSMTRHLRSSNFIQHNFIHHFTFLSFLLLLPI